VNLLVTGLSGQLGAGLRIVSASHGLIAVRRARETNGPRWKDPASRASLGGLKDVVVGDVSQPMWGLTDEDLAELSQQVDGVVNLAATTDWMAPKAVLHGTNIHGAVAGYRVAERLRSLAARCSFYCHVSSIHVAGEREGVIAESFLEQPEGLTAYEYSKWAGESRIRHEYERSGLPTLVARVGGLLGRSLDGGVTRRSSLYMLLDYASSQPLPLLPVESEGRVDVLPSDVVARALLHLIERMPTASSLRIAHVCAGESAPNSRVLVEALLRHPSADRYNRMRVVPLPARVGARGVSRGAMALPISVRTARQLIGLRYLNFNRMFERSALREVYGSDIPKASIEECVRLLVGREAADPVPGFGAGSALARFDPDYSTL